MVMKRGIRFIYLFRHFNLTPVRNLDCTSSLQPAPVLLHLPVWIQQIRNEMEPPKCGTCCVIRLAQYVMD